MGYDDIIWDPPETWADLGFSGPSLKGGLLIVCSLVGILLVAPMILKKKKGRKDGYKRVRSAVGRTRAPEYERAV